MVFTEPAKPSFKVTMPPYLSPEFFGFHSSGIPYFPLGIVYGIFGKESHGDNFN